MARKYAVIMALLAMLVVLLRAMKDGAGLDGTILNSLAWMVLLGVIGLVVGTIAQATIDESVRTKIEAELAAVNPTQQEAPAASPSPEAT